MGKDLRGKELGVGIVQQTDGLYAARYTDKHGKRQVKRFKKLQECRQWIADATYIDEHTDIENATDMIVEAWYEYWISIKQKTVRPNTVRNYTERYERNIRNVIGKKLLTEVKPIHFSVSFQIWQMQDTRRLQSIRPELLFIIFQYWDYDEPVCSHYRRGENERN